jgi:polyisoprenoid-binding protein YceI
MSTTFAPSSQTATSATTWAIDAAHSTLEFQARHMMFTTVKGRFTGVRGTILEVAEDPTRSAVEVEIDPASITTGDPQRDGHLKGPDFLDVEKYPAITFKSTRVEGTREAFKLVGDLTMRGQTHPVTLDVTFNGSGTNPFGKQVAGFSAEGKINRKDWGLTWNVGLEAGGVLVSDQLKLSLEIQAVRA